MYSERCVSVQLCWQQCEKCQHSRLLLPFPWSHFYTVLSSLIAFLNALWEAKIGLNKCSYLIIYLCFVRNMHQGATAPLHIVFSSHATLTGQGIDVGFWPDLLFPCISWTYLVFLPVRFVLFILQEISWNQSYFDTFPVMLAMLVGQCWQRSFLGAVMLEYVLCRTVLLISRAIMLECFVCWTVCYAC